MERNSQLLVGALLVSMVMGCQTHMAPGVPPAEPLQLTVPERELLNGRLHGAHRPELGIAMSGGGLRSSLVNLGVLKALYDDKVLDKVDLISSVSGGSYLAYWLYSHELSNPGERFGDRAFNNQNFLKRACEVSARANFVTYRNYAESGLKRTYSDSLREMYIDELRSTFAPPNFQDPEREVLVHELAELVQRGNAPYLVVNATTWSPEKRSDEPWNHRLFEFTPLHYGNLDRPSGKTTPWEVDGNVRSFPLIEATAASGAAISILKRSFSLPYPDSAPDDSVWLFDGGKSENLGVAAALRRGTRNLIVVDAQYDDKEYDFGAYYTLIKRENDLGLTVGLDTRPEHRKRGVYKGAVFGSELLTNLYVVKMGVPPYWRDNVYAEAGNERLDKAKAFDDEVAKTAPYDEAKGRWLCENLGTGTDSEVSEWLYLNFAHYMRWFEGDEPWSRYDGRTRLRNYDAPWFLGQAFNHKFPRITTTDQSYYKDQAMAFIGLGYWLAKDEVKRMLTEAESLPQEGMDEGISAPSRDY